MSKTPTGGGDAEHRQWRVSVTQCTSGIKQTRHHTTNTDITVSRSEAWQGIHVQLLTTATGVGMSLARSSLVRCRALRKQAAMLAITVAAQRRTSHGGLSGSRRTYLW
eukprot:scpid43772/ scgid14472/ 